MRRSSPMRLALAAVLAALALTNSPSGAGDKPAHEKPDGATSHRRFDDAAYWSKVFDDPKRDEWQRPVELVAALALKPGMTVADIGAGTGYFARRLSNAVGESGAVFVVEVEPSLIAHLRDRAEKEKTPNVVPVLASADNPRLPPSAVDVALFIDAYHHVDGRSAYLAVLQRSLKPGARVAIVEWKPGKQPYGPKEEDHKIPREQVEREMAAAGFELAQAPDLLPHQYLLVFRRKGASASAP
ncbi:MAG: class I SAM-dependent methyltransferase [Candidatus Binatia bacterium]